MQQLNGSDHDGDRWESINNLERTNLTCLCFKITHTGVNPAKLFLRKTDIFPPFAIKLGHLKVITLSLYVIELR